MWRSRASSRSLADMNLSLKILAGGLVACLMILPATVRAQPPDWAPRPPAPAPRARRGLVIDAATKKPISGVQIDVRERSYNSSDCIATKPTTAATNSLGTHGAGQTWYALRREAHENEIRIGLQCIAGLDCTRVRT